jgi:FkbM family methyltransferase
MKHKLTSIGATHFLTNPLDTVVGKSIEIYGEWSYGEVDLLAMLLKPTNNVLEVGSNIGAHTVPLARDIVPQGLVYAFEPRRLVFQLLCANIALNTLRNVHAFQRAVGREAATLREGTLPDNVTSNVGAYVLGKIEGDSETIDVIRADDWLHRFPRFSLIKADIEGYERDFLLGAQALLQRDRPMLYLENDRVDQSPELITHILGLGYDCWWHVVPLFRPNNATCTAVNIFGNQGSFNMLCIPSERGVQIQGVPKVEGPQDHPLKKLVPAGGAGAGPVA